MSHVVLFAYPTKSTTSTKSTVTKVLLKKLYCDFKWSLQFNQESTGQNFVPFLPKIPTPAILFYINYMVSACRRLQLIRLLTFVNVYCCEQAPRSMRTLHHLQSCCMPSSKFPEGYSSLEVVWRNDLHHLESPGYCTELENGADFCVKSEQVLHNKLQRKTKWFLT